MSLYTSINDPVFNRAITLGDSYRIMERFVSEYHARGDTPVVDFLTYLSIADDGTSVDPAAIYDFLAVAERLVPVENGQ